jgi:hypothetical protein
MFCPSINAAMEYFHLGDAGVDHAHLAAYFSLVSSSPQKLEDVIYLVDLAADITPKCSQLMLLLDEFEQDVEADRDQKPTLMRAAREARATNQVLVEAMLFAALAFYDSAFAGMDPTLDWPPEVLALVNSRFMSS